MRMTVALEALVVAFVVAAHVEPSRASEGPWCSHYFGTDYTENCSMRSFDMCIAETRGAGGRTFTTMVDSGQLRVEVRGYFEGKDHVVVREMNALRGLLGDRFERMRAGN